MNDKEFLNLIFKNAEMGKIGIKQILDNSSDERMTDALNTQLTEYNKICAGASEMLTDIGGKVEHLGAGAKIASGITASMKTMTDSSPSKLAEMMIQGSTMGVTKIMKNRREYDGHNDEIISLSDKLKQTEENNIEQMKRFL